MSKFYVSEEQLRNIFDSQFYDKESEKKPWAPDFQDWVVQMLEEGKIEIVEFSYYEVSKLDYRPIVKLTDVKVSTNNLMAKAIGVLVNSGKAEKVKEMCERVETQAKNYDEALLIIAEYIVIEYVETE